MVGRQRPIDLGGKSFFELSDEFFKSLRRLPERKAMVDAMRADLSGGLWRRKV
jgi:hypothetical protein